MRHVESSTIRIWAAIIGAALIVSSAGCTPDWALHKRDAGLTDAAEQATIEDAGEPSDAEVEATGESDANSQASDDVELDAPDCGAPSCRSSAPSCEDQPCPASTVVCKTSVCVPESNTCELRDDDSGATCTLNGKAGACNGAGACVECLSEGDGRCAGTRPHCSSANECVRCTMDSHCANLIKEKCVAGSCEVKCGDGVIDDSEDCEQGVSGWNSTNCDFATCKRTNYQNCASPDTRCKTDTFCLAKTCIPISDMTCVTSCPTLPGFKPSCSKGICYLACDATAMTGCPADLHCELSNLDRPLTPVGTCVGNSL